MVKKGKGKRQRKDNEKDPNKRPTKRTKKEQEKQETLFDILHDELIINILVHIPMRFFADVSTTCRRWTALSQKQDFWRLYALQQWGTNIAPNKLVKNSSGSVEVDFLKHLIPTIQIGTQRLVDWFRYCKIRKLFARAKRGIQLSNIADNDLWDDYEDYFLDDPLPGDEFDDFDPHDFESNHDSYEDYIMGEHEAYEDLLRKEYEENSSHDSYEDYMAENDHFVADRNATRLKFIRESIAGITNRANPVNNTQNNNNNNQRIEVIDFEKSLSEDFFDSDLESLSDEDGDENEEDEGDGDNMEEGEPSEAFQKLAQNVIYREELDDFELTTENVKNFIVELPINPGFDFQDPYFLPASLFEFLYEISPMVFAASNLRLTTKHMVEVMRNLAESLSENGERYSEKYYARALDVGIKDKTRLRFDLFLCSCKMFLQIRGADENKKNLFKKLLQTMLDLIQPLLDFDLESELQDMLKSEFASEEAAPEEVLKNIIPEIRNALQNTRVMNANFPKTCDMTAFRYPSQEIVEKSLTTKDPICLLITPSDKEFEIFNEILAHFIIDKYISSKDSSVKAAALALLDVSWHPTYELLLSLLPILCEAVQHKHEEISFGGFVALFKLVKEKNIAIQLGKKQVVMVAEAAIKGIARFPDSALYLAHIMVKLAKHHSEFVSEKLLDEFHEQIFAVMLKQPKLFLNPIVSKEPCKFFDNFWKIGLAFKDRLGKYLPKYREAFLHLAATKYDTTVLFVNIEAHVHVILLEHRLVQYILLGNAALGEKFNAEAEDFVKYLQKQKKIKLNDQRFIPLFGNVICRMNQKNAKKIKEVMTTTLESFSIMIYRFGVRPTVESFAAMGEDYETFKTIPFRYNQFKEALKVYEAKKGRRSAKNTDPRSIFQYEPPVRKEKKIKKGETVKKALNSGLEFEEIFNPFGDRTNAVEKKELREFASKIYAKNLAFVLENIDNEDILELQKVLHLFLAFLREGSAPASYFNLAFKIFEKLKPDLLIENQQRYMQIMALIISQRIDSNEKMTAELREVLLSSYEKLIVFYETTLDDSHTVRFLLSFALRYQDQYPNQKRMMVYNLLKRLIIASPKDLRRALLHCNAVGSLFAEAPADDTTDPWFIERLHIIAAIGYHFGIAALMKISNFRLQIAEMTYQVKEIFAKCVEYYKEAEEIDADLQNYMKRFIVLFTASQMEDSAEHVKRLCLFNAIFFEEGGPVKAMDLVRKKKFNTGIKALNKEAKTWENIFDLSNCE